jgi:hypothetical protein
MNSMVEMGLVHVGDEVGSSSSPKLESWKVEDPQSSSLSSIQSLNPLLPQFNNEKVVVTTILIPSNIYSPIGEDDLDFLLDNTNTFKTQGQRPSSAGNEPFLMGAKPSPRGELFVDMCYSKQSYTNDEPTLATLPQDLIMNFNSNSTPFLMSESKVYPLVSETSTQATSQPSSCESFKPLTLDDNKAKIDSHLSSFPFGSKETQEENKTPLTKPSNPTLGLSITSEQLAHNVDQKTNPLESIVDSQINLRIDQLHEQLEVGIEDIGNIMIGSINQHGALITELKALGPTPRGITAIDASQKGNECYKQGLYPNAIMWLSWAEELIQKNQKYNKLLIEIIIRKISCFKEIGEYNKAIMECTKVSFYSCIIICEKNM